MIQEYTDGELVDRIMQLIVCLHRKEMQAVRKMCNPKVMWKFGSSYSDSVYSTMLTDMLWQRVQYSDIIKFFNEEVQIRKFNADNIIATGVYRVESKVDCELKQNYFDYTVVMAEGLAVFVQLNEKNTPPKIHRVVAVNEAVYNFEETVLVYIESIKDHIVWHYGDKSVESIDTLKRLEQELSGDFIRVHRSYIVNKRKVSSIQRCSVTMTNGDNIPIPYKKYVEVREKLSL
ncbi:MAG TPA: hypothetical protein DCR27_05280 [Lachnospiraceae bacterium]|nr:hypothetical protein [Lachnospiraceae bacterium]